jgi:hypothetical protein
MSIRYIPEYRLGSITLSYANESIPYDSHFFYSSNGNIYPTYQHDILEIFRGYLTYLNNTEHDSVDLALFAEKITYKFPIKDGGTMEKTANFTSNITNIKDKGAKYSISYSDGTNKLIQIYYIDIDRSGNYMYHMAGLTNISTTLSPLNKIMEKVSPAIVCNDSIEISMDDMDAIYANQDIKKLADIFIQYMTINNSGNKITKSYETKSFNDYHVEKYTNNVSIYSGENAMQMKYRYVTSIIVKYYPDNNNEIVYKIEQYIPHIKEPVITAGDISREIIAKDDVSQPELESEPVITAGDIPQEIIAKDDESQSESEPESLVSINLSDPVIEPKKNNKLLFAFILFAIIIIIIAIILFAIYYH